MNLSSESNYCDKNNNNSSSAAITVVLPTGWLIFGISYRQKLVMFLVLPYENKLDHVDFTPHMLYVLTYVVNIF